MWTLGPTGLGEVRYTVHIFDMRSFRIVFPFGDVMCVYVFWFIHLHLWYVCLILFSGFVYHRKNICQMRNKYERTYELQVCPSAKAPVDL